MLKKWKQIIKVGKHSTIFVKQDNSILEVKNDLDKTLSFLSLLNSKNSLIYRLEWDLPQLILLDTNAF